MDGIRELLGAADDLLFQSRPVGQEGEPYTLRPENQGEAAIVKALHSLACSTLVIAKLLDRVTNRGEVLDIKIQTGGN